MSRMRKAYELRFRALLLRLRARRAEQGLMWLLDHSRPQSGGPITTHALSLRYEQLRDQVRRWELRHAPAPQGPVAPQRFLCDAGLGGLARWLRAAGYETFWSPNISDPELLRKAQQLHAIVLTTDSLMMERGVLRDGLIPALWLPPALDKQEQLGLVFREFNLALREPRCMRCGGPLHSVPKECMRNRIPPRTWRWIDDYFLCAGCGHLFWQGTHWSGIGRVFEKLGLPTEKVSAPGKARSGDPFAT